MTFEEFRQSLLKKSLSCEVNFGRICYSMVTYPMCRICYDNAKEKLQKEKENVKG